MVGDIVFICDDAFALPTGVALASLAANCKPGTEYHTHIVANGVVKDNLRRLERSADKCLSVEIVEVDGSEYASIASGNAHVSPTAMFKFRLPELFSSLDRVLYLDGDIVVNGDLSGLWSTNLERCYVAAVEDRLAYNFAGKTLRERIGYPHKRYFNSGVMLMNLALMRSDGIPEKLMEYRLRGRNDFMDQDALNVVMGGAAQFVDNRYNVTATNVKYEAENVRKAAMAEAVIYHYTSPEKPWLRSDAENVGLWDRYFSASQFADIELRRTVRSEVEALNRKFIGACHNLKRAQTERDEAVAAARAASTRADETWARHCALKESCEQMRSELGRAETEIVELERELAALKHEFELERGRNSGLEADLASRMEEISAQNGAIAKLESDISAYEGNQKALRGEISVLNRQIDAVKSECARKSAVIGEFECRVSELQGNVASYEAEVKRRKGFEARLWRERGENRITRERIESELALTVGTLGMREEEIAALKSEVSRHSLEIAVERGHARVATEERDLLSRELSGLRAELALSEDECLRMRQSLFFRIGRLISRPTSILKDLAPKGRVENV